MNQQLLSLMRARTSRDWEFLATAAGEPSSVDRTISALSTEALVSSEFLSASTVRKRVDALAAFDILKLLALAQEWSRPGTSETKGSTASPALVEAWAAALRFLPRDMQQDLLQSDVPGAWEEERLAVVSPGLRFDTWDDLVHFVQRAESYAELRAVDRASFPAMRVPEAFIEALLEIPPSRRWGRFQALRVVRPLIDHLSQNARAFLLELALASWREFSGDNPAQLLLYELAFTIDHQAKVVELAAEHLRSSLAIASGPLHLLQTAYVVSGTGWTMP